MNEKVKAVYNKLLDYDCFLLAGELEVRPELAISLRIVLGENIIKQVEKAYAEVYNMTDNQMQDVVFLDHKMKFTFQNKHYYIEYKTRKVFDSEGNQLN
ncbi:TPA: hypothetical protein QB656_000537 [Pasteurella multocida]|nr:hypothetical protein [Pasteurella multocida]HED4450391.1 hypothetical protein [Pasteurella multocida]